MDKLKKLVCLILCFMLALLFACGDTEQQTDGGADNITPTGESKEGETGGLDPEADPRLAVPDDLPERDYEGSPFNILYIDWSSYQLYQFAEDAIGEVMNDAIYFRQKNVEDRFNIEINPIKISYGEIRGNVSRSVRAGSHDYDLLLTHCNNELVGLMTGREVIDWYSIPTINFEKPWWNKDAIETLTIADRLFFATSDFIIPEPNAVFFNKNMIADYGLEDPYKLVRDGNWTIAKMTEMARTVARDLDGDGEWTDQDQYGLVTQYDWYFLAIAQSAGMKIITKDADTGRFLINSDVGKMQSILEKYSELVTDKTVTFTFPYGAMGDQYISALPLSSGRVLFHFDPLPQAVRYRDSEIEFGILPFPKYDEAQEKYMNKSWNGFMAVPATVPDLEKQGIIVEALSAESYKYCVPAFYDVLMNVKLTRDEDSVEMLDIIYGSAVYDLDIAYEIYIGAIRDLLHRNSTDFISHYERMHDRAQATLDRIFDTVTEE